MRTKSKFLRLPAVAVAALLIGTTMAAFFAIAPSKLLQQKPYRVGDTAKAQIVAPKKFALVDPAETEARRQTEAAKVPAMFRFQQKAGDEAVASFSTEFTFEREKFLDVVEKNFKKRTLSTNQIATPRFRKLVINFKITHKTFPANFEQAKKWAQGDTEEELQKYLREKLRTATERFIREDALASAAQRGPARILEDGLIGSSHELFKYSRTLRRTNLVSLTKARNELLNSFPREHRAVAKILTNFVAANCVFDEKLTSELHAERTNSILVMVSYEPGQVIVGRGEIIDAKIKAALDELNIQSPVPHTTFKNRIWLWTMAIFCAALAWLICLRCFVFRSRTAVVCAGNVLVLPRAENWNESLQAKLMPHLARGLMNKLVRGLISQRSEMLQTQNAGSEQLNELELRLEHINARLQARQAAYEKRITELEKELAVSEDENRELIHAKIREARQNMESAKAQGN